MLIRDAVHQDIFLRPELTPLVDTLSFQRLRGIKQLGTANLVYVGALHTRFDHSLGTYFLCRRLLEVLGLKGHVISEREQLLCELYALLHDITHIPFGHTFEDERKIFGRHDDSSRYKIYLEGTDLGEELEKLGLKNDLLAILDDSNSEAKGKDHDSGCHSDRGSTRKSACSFPPFIKGMTAGTIGADLLDYLKRDAFYCGLKSQYDERIFHSFSLDDSGHLYVDLHKKGSIRKDQLSEIINLLRIRYYLSERVYYHHTKIVAGAMLSRAVECLQIPLQKLAFMSDEELLLTLKNHSLSSPSSDKDEGVGVTVQTLMNSYLSRRLYKRIFMVSDRSSGIQEQKDRLINNYHNNSDKRVADEERLASLLEITPADLIFYCPPGKMFMKQAEIPVMGPSGKIISLSTLPNSEINVILDNYRQLWKFFVFIRPGLSIDYEKAQRVCEDFFGMASEFRLAASSGQ